jgi:hypothetical protein
VGEDLVRIGDVLLLRRSLFPAPHRQAHREQEIVMLARSEWFEGGVSGGYVLLQAIVRQLVFKGVAGLWPYRTGAVRISRDEVERYERESAL